MKMNSKSINRKRTVVYQPNMQSNKKLPSTSRESFSSLYAVIGNKMIPLEEHNKVMIQNQRLAKENAYLKSRLNDYKNSLSKISNENVDFRQQLSAANTHIQELKNQRITQISPISDKVKTAVNILMEDYSVVESIKKQLNDFEGKVESLRTIMSSLQTIIEDNDESNQSFHQNSETSSERSEQIWSTNNSIRRSLSSQEIRRRLSSERIQRDFHILSELSSIMEVSTEHRMSSLSNGFDGINESNASNVVQRESFSSSTDLRLGSGESSTSSLSVSSKNENTMKSRKSLSFSTTVCDQNLDTTSGTIQPNANSSTNFIKAKPIKTKAKKQTKTTKNTKTKTESNNEKQNDIQILFKRPLESVVPLINGMPLLVNNTNTSVSTATTTAVNNTKGKTNNATKSSNNSKTIPTKAKNMNKTTKTAKTKTKKKCEKQTESKTKANDSVLSIYDFDDDEGNKENAIPVIPVIPPKRQSKRINSMAQKTNGYYTSLI